MAKIDPDRLKLFTGRANPQLAQKICDSLGIPLGRGHTDLFPDGELMVKVEEDVRGRDCYVVQPTCQPVNAHLMELMIWIDCLRRASAKAVTAVIPYFGYARQDRKDEGRTPITAKLVANLLERRRRPGGVGRSSRRSGTGFFRYPGRSSSRRPRAHQMVQVTEADESGLCVAGCGKRQTPQIYANKLGGEICIIDKRRKSGSETEARHIIGDVNDKNVLMVDDMITTAGTMTEAVRILRDNGAKEIFIAATHAIFAGEAMKRLAKCSFTKIAVTDTIPLGNRADAIKDRLEVLSVADLLGEAIKRIHHNESVSHLFEYNGDEK